MTKMQTENSSKQDKLEGADEGFTFLVGVKKTQRERKVDKDRVAEYFTFETVNKGKLDFIVKFVF